MYLGQLLQGDVQLVLHVLHLLLKIADLHKYCKICQILLKQCGARELLGEGGGEMDGL